MPASPEPGRNSLRSINPDQWANGLNWITGCSSGAGSWPPSNHSSCCGDCCWITPRLMFSSNGDNARLDQEFEQAGVVPDVRQHCGNGS